MRELGDVGTISDSTRGASLRPATVAKSSPNARRNVVQSPEFFAGLASVIVAFEGTVMRILVVAAVIAASCALSGCFHFHTSQVVTAPQPLPPLK
jgi:hypothetical protein